MYKLPDGQEIELGACRNRAPEVLFRPELIGAEYDGIPQCISNAIAVSFFYFYTYINYRILHSLGM